MGGLFGDLKSKPAPQPKRKSKTASTLMSTAQQLLRN